MGIQPNFWKIYVSRSKDLTSNSIKNKIDLLKSELETILTWGLWLRREIFFLLWRNTSNTACQLCYCNWMIICSLLISGLWDSMHQIKSNITNSGVISFLLFSRLWASGDIASLMSVLFAMASRVFCPSQACGQHNIQARQFSSYVVPLLCSIVWMK